MHLAIGRYLRYLILFSLSLGGLGYIVLQLLPGHYNFNFFPYLFAYFFGVTLIIHLLLIRWSEKGVRKLINYYMGLTMFKLFCSLTLLALYIYFHKEAAVPFTISFVCLYLLYSFFEAFVFILHRNNTSLS